MGQVGRGKSLCEYQQTNGLVDSWFQSTVTQSEVDNEHSVDYSQLLAVREKKEKKREKK